MLRPLCTRCCEFVAVDIAAVTVAVVCNSTSVYVCLVLLVALVSLLLLKLPPGVAILVADVVLVADDVAVAAFGRSCSCTVLVLLFIRAYVDVAVVVRLL